MMVEAHPDIVEQFSAYYDGELDAAGEAAFESHLDACEGCSEEFESFCHSLELVHGLAALRAPDTLLHDVTKRLQRQGYGGQHLAADVVARASFRIPYEVFAVVMLSVMAALYLMGQGGVVRHVEPLDDRARGVDPVGNVELAGVEAPEVVWALAAGSDLRAVAQVLRAVGWHVQPEVTARGDGLRIRARADELSQLIASVQPWVARGEVPQALRHIQASGGDDEVLTVVLVVHRATDP